MSQNPFDRMQVLGQSIWLDYIRRDLVEGGGLAELVGKDSLKGMTSNPAIFEKAISESRVYDDAIEALVRVGNGAEAIYDALSLQDVAAAADVFRKVHEASDGLDGQVSLEVNPRLAHDAAGTIAEGRRLWAALDRPNVLVKVPATDEGLVAIRTLISEGIGVNATLLFGLRRYREVVEAYLLGLEDRDSLGLPLGSVVSVASFFISRIDAMVDPLLRGIEAGGGPSGDRARGLRGATAIACAKAAYGIQREVFGGERFRKLSSKGGRVQRLLWASTGTKDPEVRDTKYVDALIGRGTVDTLPMETLIAYRDHGDPAPRLEEGGKDAVETLVLLAGLGIDLDDVALKLEIEGAVKFETAFGRLISLLVLRTQENPGIKA